MAGMILIASRDGCSGIGGLAGYQRGLGAALETAGYNPVFCSMHSETRSAPPAHFVFDVHGRELRKFWMSLASRPWTHRLLQTLIERHFASETDQLASKPWRAVHYVGTGWDLMGFAMHALARKCGVPFTIWPAVHPGVWGDDAVDLRLYGLADTIFCQSRHEAEHLSRLGLDIRKTVISGLPPMCRKDGNPAALRERLGIGKRPAVFFLGRRDHGKGYPFLLDAWPSVYAKEPDAVLLLAGPGDIDPGRLQSFPSDTFRDLGIPDEQEKADAYSACDIFCLPSSHESFGIVFVEAWSYRKPVICGTAPATREWIKDGITGLWASADPNIISQKLLLLLRSPELREQLGSAGREFQQSALTWDSVVNVHLKAFGLGAHSHA